MIGAAQKNCIGKRPTAECMIAGESAILDLTGAMFLPNLSMLVVSDLHFEKGTAWAKRRIFLPPYDTHATFTVLEQAVGYFAPRTVLFLGDSFHDEGGPDRLDAKMVGRLDCLATGRELIWVTGNHDPVLPDYLPGTCLSEYKSGSLHFSHIPDKGVFGQVSGHLHPVAVVKGRGRTVRRRCFASDGARMILPSIGAFTGGLNLKDRAFDDLFNEKDLIAYAIGDSAVHAIPANACGR